LGTKADTAHAQGVERLTLATRITVMRLGLVPVFCYFIYQYTPDAPQYRWAAFATFVLAALSDLLDGYIARHWDQQSALGTRLDPMADKLLINLGYIFIAANPAMDPAMPKWFPVALVGRDVVLVAGAYLIQRVYTSVAVAPRILGKANTAFQIACMLVFLLALPLAGALLWGTLIIGVASLVDYMAVGIAQARARAREAKTVDHG
jgi:cardiolipin synthase